MASILLIDDNPQFRHEVCLGLEDAGHRVTEASNGDEGLQAFKSDAQDIVITDVVMDHGEGVETMRWIHEVSPEIPVIAISAHEDYLKSMEKLGAARSLQKPFRIKALIETVHDVLAVYSIPSS
ncbi:MAG: response regulator [Rhodospirillales bacterium]|nr:response regulator [Alphaproteobacteria bacterium]MBL6948201.1 response regulator [Rhodospirillales bacterium]